jgi:hypothetical protein
LALLATHCSRGPLEVSRSKVSESQAQDELDLRVRQTEAVRAQVQRFREALAPVESVLRDLGRAIDMRVADRPGGVLATLLDRLESVLRGAVKGLVEEQAGGGWQIEQPSPLSMYDGQATFCSDARVRLTGTPSPSGGQIALALSDCAEPDTFHTLATIATRADHAQEIHLTAASFVGVQALPNALPLGPCTLVLTDPQVIDLHCDPLSITSGELTAAVSTLEYHAHDDGIHAAIEATLTHSQRGDLGTRDTADKENKHRGHVGCRCCGRRRCGRRRRRRRRNRRRHSRGARRRDDAIRSVRCGR